MTKSNVSLRDRLRGKILSSKKFRRVRVTLFGEEVDIRQPTLGEALALRDGEDMKENVVKMLITYCYVPDTDEKLFEEADRDSLLSQPLGNEMTAISAAIEELTDIDLQMEEEVKN